MSKSDIWITLVIVLALGIIAIYAGGKITAMSQCLAEGYKEGKVDVLMNRYCVKRVDQTDVVKPLHEVRYESKNEK